MELVGLAEIADHAKVAKQTALAWTQKDSFPNPIESLRMGRVWELDAVEAWMDRKRRAESLRV